MSTPTIHIRPENADFLDLPWDIPVSEWETNRLVDMPTGVHRHPVVFVAYQEGVYAIKEMPRRLALNEHRVLMALEERTTRSARTAGLVERTWLDPHEEGAGAVITRYVEHSFPFRRLVSGSGFGERRNQMLDAIAGLLVELHMAGCYWGDCSLSNLLYRFDAEGIEAVMIDGETSEIHETLSQGQRDQDLDIMTENLAGEMSDIAAMSGAEITSADLSLGDDIAKKYASLWAELNDVPVIGRNEAYKIRERISRIHELGFSVQDIDIEPTESGDVVTIGVRVGGRTYNSDRLREVAGVEASEKQALVILGDLEYFLAKMGARSDTRKSVGTFLWLTESFEPIIARIGEVWHGEDAVQGYCDFLNHRMALATARAADVPNEEAFDSWVEAGFPGFTPV